MDKGLCLLLSCHRLLPLLLWYHTQGLQLKTSKADRPADSHLETITQGCSTLQPQMIPAQIQNLQWFVVGWIKDAQTLIYAMWALLQDLFIKYICCPHHYPKRLWVLDCFWLSTACEVWILLWRPWLSNITIWHISSPKLGNKTYLVPVQIALQLSQKTHCNWGPALSLCN